MNRAEKYAVAVDHVKANVWKCEKCGDLIPDLYKSCPYCMYDNNEPCGADQRCIHGKPYDEPCRHCNPPPDDSYLSDLLLQRFYLDREIKRIGESK